MADNPYINKVEANNQTLIDLTSDTATAGDVLEGRTLHLASGAPATGTYRPSDEIEARLEATVGHSSKNLLDLTKYRYNSTGVSNISVTPETGSVSADGSGSNRTIYIIDEDIRFKNGKTYIVSCTNNLANSAGRLAIRKRTTNVIYTSVSFSTIGKKSITFTPNDEVFPDGFMISLFITSPSESTGSIDVSDFMMRESSISDDTFEPYVTPTDEKKQDKPVVLWAWDPENPVQTVSLSALGDSILNYSIIKIFFNWRNIFSCMECDAEILYNTDIQYGTYFGATLYDIDPSFSSASISLDCPQTAINLYAHRIGDGADLTRYCAIVKIVGIPK